MLGIQHEIVGSVIGIIFSSWILMQGHPLIAAACFLVSIWGATLPDLIDPPTSPFHRSIGHNFVSFFTFLIAFLISISLAIIFRWWGFIIVSAFSLAVVAHLICDMLTPMGLPMFVGKSVFGIFEIPLYFIPIINIIMTIITIILAVYSIKFLAKKIGGIPAFALLFIPIWSFLLLGGIALSTLENEIFKIIGFILVFLFVILMVLLSIFGHVLDLTLKTKKVTKKATN